MERFTKMQTTHSQFNSQADVRKYMAVKGMSLRVNYLHFHFSTKSGCTKNDKKLSKYFVVAIWRQNERQYAMGSRWWQTWVVNGAGKGTGQ